MSVFRRLISVSCCALVAIGSLLPGQATARQPLLGVFIDGKDLTPDEMVQVRRLVQPTGKASWLIYGFRYGLGGKSSPRRTELGIYLQPDVEDGRLRRGRVLKVATSGPTGTGRHAPWRLESTAKYAQVVVRGRPPGEITERWDRDGPFVVSGEFDDQTLVSLVALIRTSPEGPRLPNGASAARINGLLAISYVHRTDNGVEVTLNADAYHGERVTLEERNGRFVIVEHGVWIV